MLLWLAAALAAPPVLVAKAEPLGSGDDRTATAIEERVRSAGEAWLACWATHATGAEEPLRFVLLELKMRSSDGGVRKVKVRSSTGAEALDACAVDNALKIVLDPPPMFEDRIRLAITWSLAPEDRPPAPTP